MSASRSGLLVALLLSTAACTVDPLVYDTETGQRREAITVADLEGAGLPDCDALSYGLLAEIDDVVMVVDHPEIGVYTSDGQATCVGPLDDESDPHPDQDVNEGPTPQPSEPGAEDGPTPQPSQPGCNREQEPADGPTPQPSLPEDQRLLIAGPTPQPSGE